MTSLHEQGSDMHIHTNHYSRAVRTRCSIEQAAVLHSTTHNIVGNKTETSTPEHAPLGTHEIERDMRLRRDD